MRVDALDGYGEKLPLLALNTDYQSMIAVKHKGKNGENPHFHIVVRTEVAGQAFRVRMRKVFDQGKGNRHMSIKPWDGNNDAISYLFHEDENTPILVQHNVSDETVAKAKQRNRQVGEIVEASKSKASWLLEAVVFEELKGKPTPPEHYIGQRLIINALRSGKYVPQPWLIRAMTQRIQFKLLDGNDEAEEEFAMRLSRQIFYREQ